MNPQGGSFGSAIGASSGDLQEAMARRGMGGSATAVVSPASASAPQNAPLPAPAPTTNALPPSSATGMGLPPNGAESQTIVKALDSRLKSLSKLQEMGVSV